METLFHTLLTLLLFVAISHTLPPLAGSFPISNIFPAVFNFGDSNSDTGELSSGLGFLPQPSYEKTYFRSPTSGRFCNGRLIVDFLSNHSSFLNPLFFKIFHLFFNFHDFLYKSDYIPFLFYFVPRQNCHGFLFNWKRCTCMNYNKLVDLKT